jgi:LPS sulfotransferase NodH
MSKRNDLTNETAEQLLARLIAEAAAVKDGINPFSTVSLTPEGLSKLPPRNDSWKPNYVICMTARTGSTMLCSVLEQTGLVGRPDEYINPRGPFPMYHQSVGDGDLHVYFHRLWEQHSGPGGIFGLKTPFQDWSPFIQSGLFDQWFRNANMIYLSRANLFEQAVSVAIARETGVWHRRTNEQPTDQQEPTYDHGLLKQIVKGLIREQVLWESFFVIYEIEPLRIHYEAFAYDPVELAATTRQVLRFLGYDVPADYPIPAPETRKLARDVNGQWAERLREELTHDPEIRGLLRW